MVYHRTKVQRSTFRKLPFGAVYWLGTATNADPTIKVGRKSSAADMASGGIKLKAVADITAAVVKVPRVFQRPVVRQ